MTQLQLLVFLLLGHLATVAAVVWLYGAYGLLGAGVITLVVGLLTNPRKPEGG